MIFLEGSYLKVSRTKMKQKAKKCINELEKKTEKIFFGAINNNNNNCVYFSQEVNLTK